MSVRPESELDDERALAASVFPDEWATALTLTGRRGQSRRTHLRKAAIEETKRAPLRAIGASCANCYHRLHNPVSLKGEYCDLDSDSGGYMTTHMADLCSRWRGRNANGDPA